MDVLAVMFCAVPMFAIGAAVIVQLIFNGRLPGMWRR